MAKQEKGIRVDEQGPREGHVTLGRSPRVNKGTFLQVGEFAEGQYFTTYPKAISPNVKSGTSSGGEQ